MTKNESIGEIIFADKFFPLIATGKKTTTVRAGKRFYREGVYDVFNPTREGHMLIKVKKSEHTMFSSLTDETALTDGFTSVEELKKELLQFYPNLEDNSTVTIVYFEFKTM